MNEHLDQVTRFDARGRQRGKLARLLVHFLAIQQVHPAFLQAAEQFALVRGIHDTADRTTLCIDCLVAKFRHASIFPSNHDKRVTEISVRIFLFDTTIIKGNQVLVSHYMRSAKFSVLMTESRLVTPS